MKDQSHSVETHPPGTPWPTSGSTTKPSYRVALICPIITTGCVVWFHTPEPTRSTSASSARSKPLVPQCSGLEPLLYAKNGQQGGELLDRDARRHTQYLSPLSVEYFRTVACFRTAAIQGSLTWRHLPLIQPFLGPPHCPRLGPYKTSAGASLRSHWYIHPTRSLLLTLSVATYVAVSNQTLTAIQSLRCSVYYSLQTLPNPILLASPPLQLVKSCISKCIFSQLAPLFLSAFSSSPSSNYYLSPHSMRSAPSSSTRPISRPTTPV